MARRTHQAESCSGCGVHPSVTNRELGGHPNAVAPKWTYCRVCDLIEQAKAAGPPVQNPDGSPGPGWRLELVATDKHPHRRTAA